MTKLDNTIQLVREKQPVDVDQVKAYFDQRPPISPKFILGNWRGLPILTGNSLLNVLHDTNWAGKNFHTVDKVDPMVCLDENGTPFADHTWGAARIREVKFNGVVSAAMVYNQRPIIDHFRYVDEQTVIGVMDNLDYPSQGNDHLYFILERIH